MGKPRISLLRMRQFYWRSAAEGPEGPIGAALWAVRPEGRYLIAAPAVSLRTGAAVRRLVAGKAGA